MDGNAGPAAGSVAASGDAGAVAPAVVAQAGGSGAAAAYVSAEFHRLFGGDGAAARFAAMDRDGSDASAATAMLRALKVIFEDERRSSGSRASAIAFAASPALMTLREVLPHHHRGGKLMAAAIDLLHELGHIAAAQADLARVDVVGAAAQLLSRLPAADAGGNLSAVAGNCFWLLRLTARDGMNDEALLRPSTAAAIACALPAEPMPGAHTGGAFFQELTGVAGAATALHMAVARTHHMSQHIAAIKLAAPSFEAQLNAWLPILSAVLAHDEPLLLHAKAMSELLAASPVN